MNYQNYLEIKDFKYEQYVEYLINKYGEVPGDYCSAGFSPNENIKRKQSDNLYIHHIREDKVAGLSDMTVAATAPFEYQQAKNLVYCNLLEHILLHIMIGEQNQGLGFGGAQKMIMQANDIYAEENEVLEELKVRCENSMAAYSTQEEYIITLLNELTETLQISDRALCVLGTGLGKTKLGLEYLRKFGYKALVLCPDNTVKDNWEKWGKEETRPITYASFMRSYAKEDYSKYQILICDEAHRCTAPKWGEGVRYVLEKGLLKVIGLTATPKEKKDKKNFETTAEFFNHKVCQGYTILDGIENGIIHDFSYIGAIYDTSEIRQQYANINDKVLLGELDLELNNTPTMDEILTRHMPKSKRKGIIFVSSIEAMDEAENIMRNLYPNIEYKRLHSHLPNREIKDAKDWFEETDEGYLLTVNMVNEGAHYSGINTLIMFRKTQSSLLFNQQLGRIIIKTDKKDPEGIVFDLVNNANLIENAGDRFATSLRKAYKARKERGGKEKSDQIIIADYAEKISEVLERIRSVNNKKITVYQYDLYTGEYLKTYPSCQIASMENNINHGGVWEAIQPNNKNHIAGNYRWLTVKSNNYADIVGDLYIWDGKEKTVYQYSNEDGSLIKEWRSYKEASLGLGLSSSAISTLMQKGGCGTCGGFLWLDTKVDNYKEIGKLYKRTAHNAKKVVQYSKDKSQKIAEYNSCREAGQFLNLDYKGICRAAKGRPLASGEVSHIAYDYYWEYIEEEE